MHELITPHRLIKASAGSGKTYLLSGRYLSLLRDGAPPGAILATTFTRKAAGEILQRVLERLVKACESDAAGSELMRELAGDFPPLIGTARGASPRVLLRELVDQLPRLSVSTLDSFFHRIVQAFAMELSLPTAGSSGVLDDSDPQIAALREQAIEAMLLDASEDGEAFATLLDLLRRLHHDEHRRSVTGAIDRIVSELYEVYREQSDPAAWSNLQTPAGLLDDAQLARAAEALPELISTIPTTQAGKPRSNYAKALDRLIRAAHLRDWLGLLDEKLVQVIAQGGGAYDRVEPPVSWIDAISPLILHARAAQLEQLRQSTIATHALLSRFDAHFARLKRGERVYTFADLTQLLRQVTPACEEIYYRLDGRLQHLLLDEFQDTSLGQWQVLAPMASEITSHADGEHSFFCVGDLKQAIYGWRGGCSQLFDLVKHQLNLPDDAEQTRSQSWRSSQAVLDAVNRLFANIDQVEPVAQDPAVLDAVQAWQANFQEHTAARTELNGYVCLESSPPPEAPPPEDEEDPDPQTNDDNDDAPAAASRHQLYVADRIAALHREHPTRSLGVLVRKNREAGVLLDLLRQRGIAASGEGGVAITDDYMVNLVLAAMRLADHPGDTIARFMVLNSPLAEVVELRSMHAGDAARTAAAIRARLADEGYAAVTADWTRQLRPCCDARNARRLTQLVQLADAYEQRNDAQAGVRPMAFVRYIEQQRVEESRGETSGVRVMTIHRSKGLEFDLVVLPELASGAIGRVGVRDVCLYRKTETGPIESVVRYPNKALRAQHAMLEAAYQQQRRRRVEDDLSGLYVAMTRARFGLWMIVPALGLNSDGNHSKKGWSDLSYAAVLRRGLAGDEPVMGQATLWTCGEIHGSEDASVALRGPTSVARGGGGGGLMMNPGVARAMASGSPSGLEHGGVMRGAEVLSPGGSRARARGTVFHAWFELVGFVDRDGLPDEAALRRAAAEAGVACSEEELTQWMQRFEEVARTQEVWAALSAEGLAEKSLGETLAEKLPGAGIYQELSLMWRRGRELFRGRADRVVVWGDAAEVVDFKTDERPGGVDEAAWFASLRERYGGQVSAYRDAVAGRFGLATEQVRGRLVLVSCGRVLDV